MYGFIYAIILVVAAINGFGASILYVAQGKYLSECATEKTKGLFYGIYLSAGRVAQVTCNLLAAFVITEVSGSTFYIILTCLCCSTCLVFLFLKQPV
jgi:MFS family permease